MAIQNLQAKTIFTLAPSALAIYTIRLKTLKIRPLRMPHFFRRLSVAAAVSLHAAGSFCFLLSFSAVSTTSHVVSVFVPTNFLPSPAPRAPNHLHKKKKKKLNSTPDFGSLQCSVLTTSQYSTAAKRGQISQRVLINQSSLYQTFCAHYKARSSF